MKKINLGVLLIIVTLVILIIYIYNEEKITDIDKKNIEKTYNEYVLINNKYYLLQQENRNINSKLNLNIDKYNEYLLKMKNELSEYVLDSRLEDVYSIYKNNLDDQVAGKYLINEYNKEFKSIREYNKNGPYISVVLDVILKINRDERINPVIDNVSNMYNGKITNLSITLKGMEFLVFKKIENKYKIVIHNIFIPVLGIKDDNNFLNNNLNEV